MTRPKTSKSGASSPRGVALVEAVIEKHGEGAEPLTADVLAALRLDGGRPLPASVARWLAHDTRSMGWFDPRVAVRLPRLSFHEAADLALDAGGAFFPPAMDEVLPGACYPIDDDELDAGERFHFLYAGEAAEGGELPVLCADTSDSGSVGLAAPGFDVYLAQRFGLIVRKAFAGSCPAGMQASWKAQVKANLGARAIIEALEYMDDDLDADALTPGGVCRAYAYHRKMGLVAARAALGDALGGLFVSIQRESKAKAPDGARLTLEGGRLSVTG